MTHLETLLHKFREDELFRRLATGSPTWSEMIAEAILNDRSEGNFQLAPHNASSIDLIAKDGHDVQVKTVGTKNSFAGIHRGRDKAAVVFVITTFGEVPRFFLIPMDQFKGIARIYDYPKRNHYSWEISGSRINSGVLDAFEFGLGTYDDLLKAELYSAL